MKLGLTTRGVLAGAILLAGVAVVTSGCGEKKPAGPIKGDPTMVVAEVNGEKILLSEVDRAVQQLYKSGRRGDVKPNAPEDSLQAKAVDDLISQRLLYAEAKKAGSVPTDQEATDFINGFWQQRGFPSEDSFLVALKGLGMTKEQFQNDWRMNQGINKFLQKAVVETVKVTPEQARAYYDSNPQEFQHAEMMNARHILLRVPDGATPEASAAVKARIDGLAAQIKRGADFGELAKSSSDDTQSGQNGGELGQFPRGAMPAPIDSVAFSLQTGQVSAPVRSQFGWHLIQAGPKSPAGPYPFEQIQDRLLQMLSQKRAGESVDNWVKELKAKAKIKRKV